MKLDKEGQKMLEEAFDEYLKINRFAQICRDMGKLNLNRLDLERAGKNVFGDAFVHAFYDIKAGHWMMEIIPQSVICGDPIHIDIL